jgi:hypothetical protein
VDEVTTESTRAGGLGTTAARVVFLFVWICGVWLGTIDVYLTPFDPLNAAAYVLALVGCLILTRPNSHRLSSLFACFVVAIAVCISFIALYRAPDVMDLWGVNFAMYLVAFLIPRGNPLAGAVGSGLILMCTLVWGIRTDPSGANLPMLLGIPVGSLLAGIVWRSVLRRIVLSERSHRGVAVKEAERATATEMATGESQKDLREIHALAAPVLRDIARGRPVDDRMRRRLSVIEATIRDQIRAPQIHHPVLLEEFVRLRERGVTVVVLGEPHQEVATIETALACALTELIAPLTEGRITIRCLPSRSTAAVSLVLQTQTRSEQLLLSADGRVLSRV